MFALLREVQILYMNYEDTRATGPNCIPTARNESCAREGELPGDDGLYGEPRSITYFLLLCMSAVNVRVCALCVCCACVQDFFACCCCCCASGCSEMCPLFYRLIVTFPWALFLGLIGKFTPDFRPASSEPPVGGDYVYWEHERCTLDVANGTCR
jgi:hypothetical protein